jgi:nucleoside 2-deoxyribosyltransferase
MKLLIYIAGPYTKPDCVENTHKMIKVADELVSRGLCPVIPTLNLLWHIVTPRPPEFWYEYDLEILARCDAVLRLPGESVGADREVKEAHKLGIPVFDYIDHVFRRVSSEGA